MTPQHLQNTSLSMKFHVKSCVVSFDIFKAFDQVRNRAIFSKVLSYDPRETKLEISKIFDKVWHRALFSELSSYDPRGKNPWNVMASPA